jgi:hypothetical protein
MKNDQAKDVVFTISLRGKDVKSGAPNVDVRPTIIIRNCSDISPCLTEITNVQFIVPTSFEVSNDPTACMVMEKAVWRDGCVPTIADLCRNHDGTYSLPPYRYIRDMLGRISSTQTSDSVVSIYFDTMGSLIFRYNIGVIGAVLFMVSPNMSMEEIEELRSTDLWE